MQSTESVKENNPIQIENPSTEIAYPKAPKKIDSLRSDDKPIRLISNLMKLTFSNPLKKVYIYSIDISPEIAKDNYTLQIKIYKIIDPELSKYFDKKSLAGYNLFGSTTNPREEIIITETIENKEYKITFKIVGALNFEEIMDIEGINQKKKNFIEKLIKDILLSSKDAMRFGSDRMILQMRKENVINNNDKSTIYKGFYTSAQITQSGLFLMVLNMNKYISGKTMYEKIRQIRDEHSREHESVIREIIEEYIAEHKTVLTSYGSFRAYRIESIDFEKSPINTNINIKTPEGVKTVSIFNYYKNQYRIDIKDKEQPLLIAESKMKGKNLLTNNEKQDIPIIYLIPELVLITGIENDQNSKSRRQNIISMTKTDPNQRMREINRIHDLMNCDIQKQYKKKDKVIVNKSSKELAEEWGINLGDPLSFEGRLLKQPTLIFDNKKEVYPKNGLFRTDVTYDGVTITQDNLMYIYNKRDRADFKGLLKGLFSKAVAKGIKVKTDPYKLDSYGFEKTYYWEDIKNELKRIRFSDRLKMVIVFIDNNLEKYYPKLKEYLTNVIKVNSQFIQTKGLMNPKRAGSIMFNIVEQINIKMGGANFYIDLINNKIIDNKIYLIIGLESKKAGKDSIDYVLTYAYNQKLNRTHTVPRTCKNNKEDIEKTLNELMDEALKGLRETGKAPHPPNYVIIYRQGGNHIQNLKLFKEEVPIFVNYIKNKKENSEKFRINDTKLTYVCCNLKGDLKFFEESNGNNGRNGNYNNNYSNRGGDKHYLNPPSGLCVDEVVTQKDKYEFFIQPQFVNQGTATPCHYEVMYNDYDEKNPENGLSMEKLENLSFQLSYYYWTWSGAVRVPGILKLSTTAIDYYSRCLNHQLSLEGKKFKTPGFI